MCSPKPVPLETTELELMLSFLTDFFWGVHAASVWAQYCFLVPKVILHIFTLFYSYANSVNQLFLKIHCSYKGGREFRSCTCVERARFRGR